MTENDKREFIKYILATPLIKLVEDYKSADKQRKQELVIYCSALLKRFQAIKAKQYHIDKLAKFIKLTTGLVKIKPASSDNSDSAEQP
jgi:Zn-dependent M16 (insulinase) family peptidase